MLSILTTLCGSEIFYQDNIPNTQYTSGVCVCMTVIKWALSCSASQEMNLTLLIYQDRYLSPILAFSSSRCLSFCPPGFFLNCLYFLFWLLPSVLIYFCLICLILPLPLTPAFSAYVPSFSQPPHFLLIVFISLLLPSVLFPLPSLRMSLSPFPWISKSSPLHHSLWIHPFSLTYLLNNTVPQHRRSSCVHSNALNPAIKMNALLVSQSLFFSKLAHSSLNVFHVVWFCSSGKFHINTRVRKLLRWPFQPQVQAWMTLHNCLSQRLLYSASFHLQFLFSMRANIRQLMTKALTAHRTGAKCFYGPQKFRQPRLYSPVNVKTTFAWNQSMQLCLLHTV